MAVTESTVEDKIEIVGEYKHVQVRTATIIKKDGAELTRSFSRHVIAPNANISSESTEVKAICNAVHTDAVKTAYAAYLASL